MHVHYPVRKSSLCSCSVFLALCSGVDIPPFFLVFNSRSPERDWADIWAGPVLAVGGAWCRHNQPSNTAYQNLLSTHHCPCQSVFSQGNRGLYLIHCFDPLLTVYSSVSDRLSVHRMWPPPITNNSFLLPPSGDLDIINAETFIHLVSCTHTLVLT